MSHRAWIHERVALLACAWILIGGCSTPAGHDRAPCALCEEPTRYVRLQDVPREAEQAHRFSHPFKLSVQDWAVLLQSIQVQALDRPLLGPVIKGMAQPAFSDDETRYLSETLSRACADAAPDEWVVFALTRARQPGLDEMTTGAWYVQGDQIHLRLPNYRIAVSLPGVRKAMWQQPMRQQGGVSYDLVPGEFQRLKADREILDLFANDPIDLAIDFRPLIARVSTPSTPVTSPTISAPSVSPTIEERLSKLKQLREQGLITEEEFRAKKQQILEKL